MRLASVAERRRIDQRSISEFALTPEVLVEAAGALSARVVIETIKNKRARVVVLCGPGLNGADGLCCARHLRAEGIATSAVLLGESRSDLHVTQRQRFERSGGTFGDLSSLAKATHVVDALLGIGFKDKGENEMRAAIEAVNAAAKFVVSLDVPSGLDPETGGVSFSSGKIPGAVRAGLTVSFGPPVPGLFLNDGPKHAGRVVRRRIGFPPGLVREATNKFTLFTERGARRLLPQRSVHANKSSNGHALVLAGRPGFWGAGVLAARAAFRVGAGYVTWASFETPAAALGEIPEALTARIDDDLLKNPRLRAVAVGPGLGSGPEVARVIETLRALLIPVAIDADAITACVEHKLFPLPPNWVLTPHAGELARVLNSSARDIEADRLRAVALAVETTGAHVLLKGFRTVVGFGKTATLIHAGNAALAKAGTGDVLTGMIGGFLAQGLDPNAAACLAAYLHGRIADDWVTSGHDQISLSAGDLVGLVPRLIARLRYSK